MAEGTGFHYDGQDLEALADLPRYYRWIVESFGPSLRGRVLEVGAGVGNFANAWVPLAREAVLVEPAPNLSSALRQRFAGNDRVRSFAGTLAEAQERTVAEGGIQGEIFDAAVLVNVLEHVEDDRGMLTALTSAVCPGGAVLVFTPALPFLYGSLDRLVNHVRRYTRSTLGKVVRDAGLVVEDLRYFDALGVLPWFLMGRVFRVRSFSSSAAVAYDRLAVPLISAIESHLAPPFGKNLVCIARRPLERRPA